MTDALRALGEGKYVTARYAELTGDAPCDGRTAEQIIADVVERAGLEISGA